MIKSMTGFGRAEYTDGKRNITVEIKSVNHRYSDISVKMPRRYSFAEDRVKAVVKSRLKRGKVDVSIMVENITENDINIKLNEPIARQYFDNLKTLQENFDLPLHPNGFLCSKGTDDDQKIRVDQSVLDGFIQVAGDQQLFLIPEDAIDLLNAAFFLDGLWDAEAFQTGLDLRSHLSIQWSVFIGYKRVVMFDHRFIPSAVPAGSAHCFCPSAYSRRICR